MDTKTKIIIGVISACLLACIIAVMAYTIKSQRDIINALQQNSDQQRLLKDDITAIKATQLTDDNFNKKLAALNMDMDTLKADLKATNSTVTSILISTNTTPGSVITNGNNTGFIPRPLPTTDPSTGTIPPVVPPTPQGTTADGQPCFTDKYGYFAKIPYYDINELLKDKQQIPFGRIQFDVQKQAPWGATVYPREYTTSIAIATDTLGNKTAYSKMTIKSQDKIYSMPETQVQYFERLPSAQMFWWSPRVMLGIDAGYSTKPGLDYGVTAQIFTSSYGKTQSAPDWYFLGVGMNYDINNQKYNVAITPAAYKITGANSMFQNIYIAPTITMGSTGDVAVLGGIRVGL